MSFITDLYNRLFNKQLRLANGKENIKFSNMEVENFMKSVLKKGICESDKVLLTSENLSKINSICIDMNISQKDIDEIMSNCPYINGVDLRNINIENLDISKFNINYLNLYNVTCNNFNINNDNIKGMMISNLDFGESKLSMPNNIKDLVLYECKNIDIDEFKNIDLQRFSITVDMLKSNRDVIEVKNIEEISEMKNLETLELTNVKNANKLMGQIPSLKNLCIRNCGLKNVNGISEKFPNVNKLILSNNPISEMRPISEYDSKRLEKMNVILNNTSINSDEVSLIEECKFNSIDLEDTPLQQDLMSKVIISASDDKNKELSKCVNNYIFGSDQEADITEWIRFQIAVSTEKSDEINTIKFPSNITEKVMELDFIENTANEIEIKVNSNSNLENIIQTLDKHNGKNDRCVKFIIERISNISKDKIELLNSRYGITYQYDNGIDTNSYHIDEIQKIDEEIKKISEKINKDMTDEKKIEEIDKLVKEEFTFLLPKEDNYSYNTKGLNKEDKELVKIMNSTRHITNSDEIDKYNNLCNALKDKKITSRSFISIFNELSDRLDIKGDIDYRLLGTKPPILNVNIHDSKGKNIIININGIDQISKQSIDDVINNRNSIRKEEEYSKYDR